MSTASTTRPALATRTLRTLRSAALIASVLACLAAPLAAAGGKRANAKYWMGKNIGQAVKVLGQPTQMVPIVETGGAMYIYARKGERHMVLETRPDGVIVKAVNVE